MEIIESNRIEKFGIFAGGSEKSQFMLGNKKKTTAREPKENYGQMGLFDGEGDYD